MYSSTSFSEETYSHFTDPNTVIAVGGVSATGVLGNGYNITFDFAFSITGVSATGILGTVSIQSPAIFTVSGVVGSAEVASTIVWGIIDDSQTATWTALVK